MTNEASFSTELEKWKKQLQTILTEFQEIAQLNNKHLFVIGCSTSEVIGKANWYRRHTEVAEMIYNELSAFQAKTGVFDLLFNAVSI